MHGGAKMSKSKGNVIPPDMMVREHGADAVRTALMFMGPWSEGGTWDDANVDAMRRFLARIHTLVKGLPEGEVSDGAGSQAEHDLLRLTHRTVQRCTEDIEAFKFNTYIARLMELTRALERAAGTEVAATSGFRRSLETLLLLLAPCAPHLAEELWAASGRPYSVHQQHWPTSDPALAAEDEFELVIQVNGKVRDRLMLPAGTSEDKVHEVALSRPRITDLLDGRVPKKMIYVRGKIFSIVV